MLLERRFWRTPIGGNYAKRDRQEKIAYAKPSKWRNLFYYIKGADECGI
ncbi:MAG: hypothetical protein QNJ41_29645 [Xenococcaceae cyanobacterium MO_188.B32]|nr:hypothetical protein [Xenococcaceae cyanobacterium MO_188.B32]